MKTFKKLFSYTALSVSQYSELIAKHGMTAPQQHQEANLQKVALVLPLMLLKQAG
jgi:hypothetical protein